MVDALHTRLRSTAERLIVQFGQVVQWTNITADTPDDANKPWLASSISQTQQDVSIVFDLDQLEDRQLKHYIRNTSTTAGLVNGLLQPVDFEPSIRDTMVRDGTTYSVAAINPVAPAGLVIFYFIEFKI